MVVGRWHPDRQPDCRGDLHLHAAGTPSTFRSRPRMATQPAAWLKPSPSPARSPKKMISSKKHRDEHVCTPLVVAGNVGNRRAGRWRRFSRAAARPRRCRRGRPRQAAWRTPPARAPPGRSASRWWSPRTIEIDTINYQLTNTGFSQAGSLNVAQSGTVSGVIGGIPTGTGYTLALSAIDVGEEVHQLHRVVDGRRDGGSDHARQRGHRMPSAAGGAAAVGSRFRCPRSSSWRSPCWPPARGPRAAAARARRARRQATVSVANAPDDVPPEGG